MSTYAEIQEQIKKLQAEADALKASETKAVIADIKSKIQQYGLTAAQLGLAGSAKSEKAKAEVLYRKDDLTWSGAARGRKPQWVLDVLAAGENIENYRVK